MENFRKKNQPMVIGENARKKKNKREKVKGMTACLKKVECERMENIKKKKKISLWLQGKCKEKK